MTDAGIELKGPSTSVTVAAAKVTVAAAGGSVVVDPASATLTAPIVQLNGCAAPVARNGDQVGGTGTGVVVGTITGGSPTVCSG